MPLREIEKTQRGNGNQRKANGHHAVEKLEGRLVGDGPQARKRSSL